MSFITPHFNYCSETWHFCNKSASDKIEKVNERAVRFVFGDKSTPYSELLRKLGRKTLKEERLFKIVNTVYKLINHSNAPQSLKDLIEPRQSTYSLRGKDVLKMPRTNTTRYGLKSWRYLAPKIWNSLPEGARAACNIKEFTSKCRNTVDMDSFN